MITRTKKLTFGSVTSGFSSLMVVSSTSVTASSKSEGWFETLTCASESATAFDEGSWFKQLHSQDW